MTAPAQPRPRAIGLVNALVGQKDRSRDLRAISAIADDRGYQLVDLVEIDESTYLPITLIAFTASNQGAEEVVAPSSHHFGERHHITALAHALTLETWAGTTPRVTWDATR